jgi:hypothetical protein
MKRLFYLLLVLTIVVGSIAPSQGNAKVTTIGSYTWTDNCKCLQVGPSFAQYVPVSNCKGVPSTHGCK